MTYFRAILSSHSDTDEERLMQITEIYKEIESDIDVNITKLFCQAKSCRMPTQEKFADQFQKK